MSKISEMACTHELTITKVRFRYKTTRSSPSFNARLCLDNTFLFYFFKKMIFQDIFLYLQS